MKCAVEALHLIVFLQYLQLDRAACSSLRNLDLQTPELRCHPRRPKLPLGRNTMMILSMTDLSVSVFILDKQCFVCEVDNECAGADA